MHEAAEPAIWGVAYFAAPTIVALAMAAVITLLLWKKVPGAIGRSLDNKIAEIRSQLAEAEALRKDAEALKAEYEVKAMAAHEDAKAMLDRAQHEAEAIVAKAKNDSENLIGRRRKMAEEKIAAEERAAVAELRALTAGTAAGAAAALIADHHNGNSDKTLVDAAIAEMAGS